MSGEARSELQVDRDPAPENTSAGVEGAAVRDEAGRCCRRPDAPTDAVVTAVNGRLPPTAYGAVRWASALVLGLPAPLRTSRGVAPDPPHGWRAGGTTASLEGGGLSGCSCALGGGGRPVAEARVGSRGPERMDGPPVGYHPLSSDWHMTATADKGLPLGWRSPARCTDSSYGICQWRVRDYRVSCRVAHDVAARAWRTARERGAKGGAAGSASATGVSVGAPAACGACQCIRSGDVGESPLEMPTGLGAY